MRNICDTAYEMSFEVAALPFQAHANYGTWSIDFSHTKEKLHFSKNIYPIGSDLIRSFHIGSYDIYCLLTTTVKI